MSNKPGPTSRLRREDILRAAYRHFELEETQSAIAADLGISTGYLARRLKQARADGWVRFYVDVPTAEQRAAALLHRFPVLSEIEVVEAETSGGNDIAMSQILATWLNDLLAVPAGEPGHVRAVATGGGVVHQRMLDRILPRRDPCDVGPTALSTLSGRVPRWPASTIAAALSFRLQARSAEGEFGTLFDVSLEPLADLDAIRAWRQTRAAALAEMHEFWESADVVFGAATTLDHLYPERTAWLEAVGLGPAELRRQGVVGLAANQHFDATGTRVDLADGVPTIVPTIGLEQMAQKAAQRRAGNLARAVIFKVRGDQAPAVQTLIEAGIITHLVADTEAADLLLAAPTTRAGAPA